MPSYDDLRDRFDSSEELQRVCSVASAHSIVQGFTVTVHPLWAMLYDLDEYPEARNQSGRLSRHPMGPYAWPYYPMEHLRPLAPVRGYRRRDLNRRIPDWISISERDPWKTTPDPVLLTIVCRSMHSPRVGDDESDDHDGQVRELWRIAGESSALVYLEERPPATLSLSPGDEIFGTAGGTLGGVLQGPNASDMHGVTCAHVARSNDSVTNGQSGHLGTCVADSTLVQLPAGASTDPLQHPYPNPSPGNGPVVNMLDCALIDLDSPPSPLAVGGIAAGLSVGQSVRMNGAKTQSRFELGALAISYNFLSAGTNYLFRDAIELLPAPTIWRPASASLPRPGDSGAWVSTDDPANLWAAMFFGDDGARGFVIRASWVHAWAETQIGHPLTV
ncbi:MAG: hypothetical protein F4Y86_03310 [Gammaproteobacteria bacterium]|nr:hypothetical protein [Gammaproteobacteria bacterium]